MKPTAILVNTGRGALVERDALSPRSARARSWAPGSTSSTRSRWRRTIPSWPCRTWSARRTMPGRRRRSCGTASSARWPTSSTSCRQAHRRRRRPRPISRMVLREDRGSVAVLRMQHGRANALDPELLGAIGQALTAAEDAGAVVLTGTGPMFSAGVDLKRLAAGGPGYPAALLPALSDCFARLFFHPRPVLAAVNGHAIAGGVRAGLRRRPAAGHAGPRPHRRHRAAGRSPFPRHRAGDHAVGGDGPGLRGDGLLRADLGHGGGGGARAGGRPRGSRRARGHGREGGAGARRPARGRASPSPRRRRASPSATFWASTRRASTARWRGSGAPRPPRTPSGATWTRRSGGPAQSRSPPGAWLTSPAPPSYPPPGFAPQTSGRSRGEVAWSSLGSSQSPALPAPARSFGAVRALPPPSPPPSSPRLAAHPSDSTRRPEWHA